MTFLFTTPYAILDFPNFAKDIVHQILYYKTTGHPGATINPGWDYLSHFRSDNSTRTSDYRAPVLFAIGLAGIVSRPVLLLILFYPISYLLFMSGMTVNFHRNFVQVYPFIAIFIGVAFYNLHAALTRFYPNLKKPIPIVCLAAALVLLPRAHDAYQTGIVLHNTRDTRSAVIDTLNAMENVQKVVFARELRMHEQDLNRLQCDYAIQPIEIMSAEQNRDQNTLCLANSSISDLPVSPSGNTHQTNTHRQNPLASIFCNPSTTLTSGKISARITSNKMPQPCLTYFPQAPP